MLEVERHDNTRGIAIGGLTTGIIGSALASGIVPGLFGNNAAACPSENMAVNRFELSMQRELTNKDMEISYLRGRDAAKTDSLEVYRYIDGQLREIRDTLCAQAIHNQKTEDSFALARQDIAAVESRLNSKIAMESEGRCCGDNAIITYANATFYPKQVADVTVGTTSTAQTLYNPIPDCGCCGK
jgi:hypothetical protein